MSEDPSSGGGSDDGGYDGLMDDKDEKELMVECGQRQVRPSKQTSCICLRHGCHSPGWVPWYSGGGATDVHSCWLLRPSFQYDWQCLWGAGDRCMRVGLSGPVCLLQPSGQYACSSLQMAMQTSPTMRAGAWIIAQHVCTELC
jgi:hypothetical protein